jgi:hypothetical protein
MPSGYNTLVLSETYLAITETRIITIPAGNYTRINLQSTLETLLTNNSPDGLVYTISYPTATEADTFRYTFAVNANNAYEISLTFSANSPWRQLGFDVGTYTFTNVSVSSSELVSVNSLNLSYILRAFIKTNLVANATDSILEELLNFGSFPSSSVMSYQQFNFDMNTRRYNPSIKNAWSFALVDSFGIEIDLNGIPWAFSVVFYQRNKTHEVHLQDLKIQNEDRIFKLQQEQERLRQELQLNLTTTPS